MSPAIPMSIQVRVRSWVLSRLGEERGASLVEYALMVALIAMVCIAAVTALGDTTSASFSNAVSKLD